MKFVFKKYLKNENISLVFITGIFMAIVNNLVYPFVNIFLLRIGGNNKHIALLSSLQGFFSVATIFIIIIVLEYCSVKRVSTISLLLTRSFYLIFILVTFLPLEVQPLVFVFLYAMKFIPNTFYNVASTSLWGEVMNKDKEMASILSVRSVLINVTSLLVVLGTGLILNKLPKSHDELINFYKVFFLIAFIIGYFEYLQYKKFKVQNEREGLLLFKGITNKIFIEDVKSDFIVLKEIIKKSEFRYFFLLLLLIFMGWLIPMPLIPVYEYEVLKTNEFWISINISICLIMQAVGFMVWGKLVRKYNIYYLLSICFFLLSCELLVYSQLTSMFQVCIFNFFNQINVAGFIYLPLLALYKEIGSHDKIKNYFVSLYFIFTALPQIFMPSITLLITDNFTSKESFFIMAIFRIFVAFVIGFYAYNKNQSYKLNNKSFFMNKFNRNNKHYNETTL